MSSGAKLVLAMLGATLLVALIAVAGFLLTDEASVRCAEGELQDNAVGSDGRFEIRFEDFDTIEEAEAFICHRLPRLRDTGPLTLERITTSRTTNLGSLIEGEGVASTELFYTTPDPDVFLALAVTLPPVASTESTPGETVEVQGVEAKLIRTADGGNLLVWNKDGFTFSARANLGDGFDFDALLAVLESVR